MLFDFAHPEAAMFGDQFMFGDAWLVSPVTTKDAKEQSVYLPMLPSGEKWVHYYSGQTTSGGGHFIVALGGGGGLHPVVLATPTKADGDERRLRNELGHISGVIRPS